MTTLTSDYDPVERLFQLYPGTECELDARWRNGEGDQKWLYEYFKETESFASYSEWRNQLKLSKGLIRRAARYYTPFNSRRPVPVSEKDVASFYRKSALLVKEFPTRAHRSAPGSGASHRRTRGKSGASSQNTYAPSTANIGTAAEIALAADDRKMFKNLANGDDWERLAFETEESPV